MEIGGDLRQKADVGIGLLIFPLAHRLDTDAQHTSQGFLTDAGLLAELTDVGTDTQIHTIPLLL